MVTNITGEQLYINQSGLVRYSMDSLDSSTVASHFGEISAVGFSESGTRNGDSLDGKMIQSSQNSEAYGLLNMSGETWFNLSCSSLEIPGHFIKTVIEPSICGCGIAGIILTMIVLSRKTMCTSTNCYLTALAVADLLFLLILSSRIYVEEIEDCNFHLSSEAAMFFLYSGSNGPILCFPILGCGNYTVICLEVFHNLTVGITVMLAVERYIAICHPMKAMAFCTVKRARISIVILAVISLILRSPKFFELDISYVTLESGQKERVVTYTYLYNEEIYTYIVTCVILTILPLVSLTFFNVRLIVEIRKSYRYLQHHLMRDWHTRAAVSREELKMTMMLVSVVVAFFVCHTPYMVYTFMLAIDKFDTLENTDLTSSKSWNYFKNICNILLALKSSCNFILYCWFSEKFWITFKRIFCLQHCKSLKASIQPRGYHPCNHNDFNRPSCHNTKETTC